MRRALIISAIAGLCAAAPKPIPQDLEYSAIDAVTPPTITVADGVNYVAATEIPTSVLASVAADVTENPLQNARLARRAACDPLPTGKNPYNLDISSAANFRADPKAAAIASSAEVPDGYVQKFSNAQKATQQSRYLLRVYELDSYDTKLCAQKCNDYDGCKGFNIYFSRDPTQSANDTLCPNPPPTTFIRCVIYGAKVDVNTLKNKGQFRAKFETAYAGSNGYTAGSYWTLPDFAGPIVLGDAAINAPLDCSGNSYMGVKIFENTVFHPALCAEACKAQNDYNRRHPPKGKEPRLCRFFNTYIISVNDEPYGQYCAMYTRFWAESYAVNGVNYRGDDVYTKSYSFAYYNATDFGVPTCERGP